MTRKNVTSLAIVVVFGSILWAGLVALDCKDTPADTAVSFTRAYYRLSPSMAQYMCGPSSEACSKSDCKSKSEVCPNAASDHDSTNPPKAATGNEAGNCPKTAYCKELARCVNTAVENYLYEARADAADRGFGENFAKYTLSHIETRTEYLDDTTALVHLTAHRRLAINPLYAYVAGLFRIGDTYEVDESIQVKLEGGRWLVCVSSLSSLQKS